MESSKPEPIYNNIINQEVYRLERFDGLNFTRWKDKLIFLLTELGVFYILVSNPPDLPTPKDDDSDAIKAARKKREDDEIRCRGHILNSISDCLYDLFRSIQSPKEIWNALEAKYTSEKQGTDRFICMKYLEFHMHDNKSVMNQVDELQVLVSKLKDLKIEVSEQLQVAAVIAKLPLFWNSYGKKLLHTSEDLTLDQLLKHIRIEEETRNRDDKVASKIGTNVNNIESSTRTNTKNYTVGKNKRKLDAIISTEKTNKSCYFCGKK
ncbi:uncharacterized protein [Primulina huaijiensis]|uniref:uncharacterized protein n=1 Tax=Primulina huaijiensis TaxID=1492673 RepID=UPI003CC6F863